MFELTMFELMLFLHILGAGAWLGANLTRALVGPYLTRAGNNTSAAWHRATVWIGRAVHTPAAIVVFGPGFGLVGLSDDVYEMTDPFVVVGILVVIVGAVLAMTIIGPNGKVIAAAFERGEPKQVARLSRRSSVVGWVDTLLVVFAFFVMVTRWGV